VKHNNSNSSRWTLSPALKTAWLRWWSDTKDNQAKGTVIGVHSPTTMAAEAAI